MEPIEQSSNAMSRSKPIDDIKFLLDENVPRVIASFLTKKGYDVLLVPKGLKNGNVIRLSKTSLDAFLLRVDTIEGNRFLLDERGYSIIEE